MLPVFSVVRLFKQFIKRYVQQFAYSGKIFNIWGADAALILSYCRAVKSESIGNLLLSKSRFFSCVFKILRKTHLNIPSKTKKRSRSRAEKYIAPIVCETNRDTL